MEGVIQRIYELIHTPLVTPYNLLENSKLSNYNYVKYYKDGKDFICEMECESNEGTDKFYYVFDDKNHLQKIERELSNLERETLFDRELEVKIQKQKFLDSRNDIDLAL